MKRLLLFVLSHGMLGGALAQSENLKGSKGNSDQWEITPSESIKGVLGRLDIHFTGDIERNILVHRQTDDEFITSVSRNAKTFPIAPGTYRFVLSSVPIDNVPIQKGHETRLKAGYLNIVSEGDWFLYDDSKEKMYTSGNTPKKMPLPVGSYQIKLGGQFYPVIIKDGKTVEDYSPVETLETDAGKKDPDIIGTESGKRNFNEHAKWVIYTPANSIIDNLGRLNHYFPTPGTGWKSYWRMYYKKENQNSSAFSYNSETSYFPDLEPGNYLITLNGIRVENVPIEVGQETRIKTGMIGMSANYNSSWQLSSAKNERVQNYLSSPSVSYFTNYIHVSVPVGRYVLSFKNTVPDGVVLIPSLYYPLVIIDSGWIDIAEYIQSNEPSESDIWIMTKIQNNTQETGRLFLDFPSDVSWDIKVFEKDGTVPIASYSDKSKMTAKKNAFTPRYLKLPAGNYDVSLSNNLIKDVLIYQGHETRLKSGILNIISEVEWSLNFKKIYYVAFDEQAFISSGNKPRKMLLPIGTYFLNTGGQTKSVQIFDGDNKFLQ